MLWPEIDGRAPQPSLGLLSYVSACNCVYTCRLYVSVSFANKRIKSLVQSNIKRSLAQESPGNFHVALN